MATMAESTDLTTAVAATLLRAYGFAPLHIFELLETRGFPLVNFQPSIGGSASKNFNKVLVNAGKDKSKHRHRVGGKGSPSWLPVGETMIDFLARQLGFVNEEDMDDFTLNTVGQIDFDPSVLMGSLRSNGEVQRNLTKAHWNYTGANASTAARGDLKSMQEHSMDDAMSAVNLGRYDLAAHRLASGAASPSSGTSVADTGSPAMTSPPPSSPTPPVTSPGIGDMVPTDSPAFDMAIASGAEPATRKTGWASMEDIASLPFWSDATRELNRGVYNERQSGTRPGAFGDTFSDQRYYPATAPVYVVLNRNYAGADFGPIDDYTLSKIFVSGDGVSSMILALANGQRPIYRLVDDLGNYSEWFDLAMNIGKSGRISKKNCRDISDLRILWTPEGDGWLPSSIRFSLAASGSTTNSWPGVPFELSHGDAGWSLNRDGGTPTTMEIIMNPVNSAMASFRNAIVQQAISDPETLTRSGFYLLPYDDNPPALVDPLSDPNQRPNYVNTTSLDSDTLMKQFVTYDFAGGGIAGVEATDPTMPAYGGWDATDTKFQSPYDAMIFPSTGVGVFTSIDQYIGNEYAGLYLSRKSIDWDTDQAVFMLSDDQVASFEISIRDGAETTAEYAGFTSEGDRRRVRIYVRGDIPEKLLPIGTPAGSSLVGIQAYPLGVDSPDRIRLMFTNPDGTPSYYTIPDDSLKAALVDSQSRSVIGDVTASDGGYIQIQSGISEGMIPALMRQVGNERLANRVSELNHDLPIGAEGLKRIVYLDGATINVIAENPEDDGELIHIVIYPRQPGDLI